MLKQIPNRISGAATGAVLGSTLSNLNSQAGYSYSSPYGRNDNRGAKKPAKAQKRRLRFFGRSKRSTAADLVASPVLLATTAEGEEIVDMEPVFKSVEDLDAFDCAKLFVCRTAAKQKAAEELLSRDEFALLSVLSSQEDIDLSLSMSTFQLAAKLGGVSGDREVCHRRYSKCPGQVP